MGDGGSRRRRLPRIARRLRTGSAGGRRVSQAPRFVGGGGRVRPPQNALSAPAHISGRRFRPRRQGWSALAVERARATLQPRALPGYEQMRCQTDGVDMLRPIARFRMVERKLDEAQRLAFVEIEGFGEEGTICPGMPHTGLGWGRPSLRCVRGALPLRRHVWLATMSVSLRRAPRSLRGLRQNPCDRIDVRQECD